MITEEELALRLGRRADQPGPVRPLAEIQVRAQAIRKARQVRRVGALTILAGGLGVVMAGLAGPGGPSLRIDGVVTPATAASASVSAPAPTSADCASGVASARTFADLPDLLYLPSGSAAHDSVVAPALARRNRWACTPAVLQGGWYAATNGVVTRSLAVSGPGAWDPYDQPGASFGGGPTTVVRVRGGRGTLHEFTDQTQSLLFWHEPDGAAWWAEGSGMHGPELLAAVEALTISGDRLTPHPLPGLSTAVPLPRIPGPTQVTEYFLAAFVPRGGRPDLQWNLQVGRGDEAFVPPAGARRTDVRGVVAWWTPQGATPGPGELTWNDDQGRRFSITGAPTETQALAVARSLVLLRPDDPRLVALAEHDHGEVPYHEWVWTDEDRGTVRAGR